MYQFTKKSWPYFLIIFVCLAGYFVYKAILERKPVVREIVYSAASASEVYMVWGLLNGKIVKPRTEIEKAGTKVFNY